MSDDWCPRQIVFMLPGVPGVQVTATEIEIDGTIEFVIDVLDSKLSTGDLRALFFHINEDEFPGLTVTSDSPYLTERRIGANAILDLDDGATLAGKVKTGFDVGIEWGTAGGKKDDINFPVSFTLSNTTGDLTLDDLGGLLFGAKLDSVGGQGGPRGSSSKLIAFAPFAPDAVNDVYKIHHEDGVPDANTPSKNPQELVLNVLANDSDQDTPKDQLVITGIHEGPSHGTAAIGPDGKTILYTPDLDYSGPDSFEYCVSDGNGGQDHALVTLELAAVADVPIIDVEVISGASVYEFTLKVTAKENDADSSEFIDRIDAAVAGGLPAGVSIAPLGGFNPGDEPNEVVKEFKVTLPQNQDIDFDLNFTAVSEETSNGDQEVVSKAIAIEVDYNQNFFNASFFADNRDIWGPGEPFSFHEQEFIGIDDVFDPPQIDIPIPPTPLLFFGDAKIDAQVGFDFEVKITGGEFDATIPIDVQVDTVYNKTTDQFLVNPTFDISDSGAKIDGTGPGGFLSILPIFRCDR
jgi:Bacterial Ig domain